MGYEAKILCDSVSAGTGKRLTTFEVTYPRFVHAELMTHRLFSRNSASSRAIPIDKMIARVLDDPAMPVWWGKNQKGMQAEIEMDGAEQIVARKLWLEARDQAVANARRLQAVGVHKQLVNRVVEPWMWITVIVSATEWSNFFALRCHLAAQPEIRCIADMMRTLHMSNTPSPVGSGSWHLPLQQPEDVDLSIADKIKVCTARAARVSYLTHDGHRDIQADLDLHDRLADSGHWSPFEHCAHATETPTRHGNYVGWYQYRKTFEQEHRGERMP